MQTKAKTRLYFLGVLIVAIAASFLVFSQNLADRGISLPKYLNIPFVFGLDLQGGTHLVYEADVQQIPTAERDNAIEGVRDVIERRVNAFGVSEPVVQTTSAQGDYRIIVELAGVSNVNDAIKMIGETTLLEIKTVNPNPDVTLSAE